MQLFFANLVDFTFYSIEHSLAEATTTKEQLMEESKIKKVDLEVGSENFVSCF